MTTSSRRVVVIGGGVIGAASAYYLQRDGWDVTVLEKNKFGSGCSRGNCGYICPSHVLPLAEPGAVKGTFKAIFTPNSPFSIKPRVDPALWSWLWNFYRKCNTKDMLAGGHALQGLLISSMTLFEELVAHEPIDCDWEKVGLLYVYKDKARLDAYDAKNKLLTETWNEPAQKLTADEVIKLEPAVKDDIVGGWFYEHDAHLRSDRLLSSWQKLLLERGAKIVEDCEVLEIVRKGATAVAVKTTQGDFEADQFVVATGPLTPRLAGYLGCKIPIQPGKGYSLTMPRPKLCPKIPMIFPQRRVAVTPFKSGYRLGSIMEFSGYDTSIKAKRLQLLKDGAAEYLREPFTEPIEEEWFGWRPMTYDSLPIIDRSPIMDNVIIAAGHNMIGLSMSTGTGKVVAEMASKQTPHVEIKGFAVTRF